MVDVRVAPEGGHLRCRTNVRFRPIADAYHAAKMDLLFDDVSRQSELEHGTFRYPGQSPELPAARLNDRSANSKPDSHAIGLGRVEGVKKAVKRKSLQPRTRILHFYERTFESIFSRDYEHLALRLIDPSHGFDSVHD